MSILRKVAVTVIVIAAAVMVFTAIAMSMFMRPVVLDDDRTSLTIPSRYMRPNPFFWIEFAEGLDDSSRSVNVVLPNDEVKDLNLPDPQDVTAVIALVTNEERNRKRANDESTASRIRLRLQQSDLVRVELDPVGGLYRVYDANYNDAWIVLSDEPANAEGKDVVGHCLLLAEGAYSKCNIQQNIDGIAVEYSLSSSNLGRREIVALHFARLIAEWRRTTTTGDIHPLTGKEGLE